MWQLQPLFRGARLSTQYAAVGTRLPGTHLSPNVRYRIDKISGNQVALKIIDLEDVEDDIDEVRQEISALADCNCPQITEYYDSQLVPNSTKLLIAMELMACSASDLLETSPLSEQSIAYAIRQVLHALLYLHTRNRMHRDVKAANVLLTPSGVVKISDFGVSGQLSSTLGFKRKTFVGTPYWMAPEVIESSEEGYTTSADIWSVGITAIEMAKGRPPHADAHPMRVLFLIPKEPAPTLEGDYSAAFKDFIATCLHKDPTQRPLASNLLKHPFLKVTAPPEELKAEVTATMARRSSEKASDIARKTDGTITLLPPTVPAWDFGSAFPTPRQPSGGGGTGTVKATPRGGPPSARGPPPPRGGTVRTHPVGDTYGTVMVKDPKGLKAGPRHDSDVEFTTRTAQDMAASRENSIPRDARRGAPADDSTRRSAPRTAPSPRVALTERDISSVTQGLSSPILREVLVPALRTAAGGEASPAAAAAIADTVHALARLEAAAPRACLTIASSVLSAVAATPLSTSAGDVKELKELSVRLAGAAGSAPGAQAGVEAMTPMQRFLTERWQIGQAKKAAQAPPR